MAPDITLAAAARAIAAGALDPVELTEAVLARIAAHDSRLHSYIFVAEAEALRAAEAARADIRAGRHRGPLHGIPIGFKDNIAVAGMPLTGNSRLYRHNVAGRDAAVVERLRRAGAIIVGKQEMHELAVGGLAVDLPFPSARNPWNTDHVTGGSSSGSAAGVAAGMCLGALGTDAGGSVRQPALLTGLAGLKPTYGRVSLRGIMGIVPSVDHCGPIAWTSEDAAILLQGMAGYDPADPASADVPVPDYSAGLRGDLKGLRIGIVRHFYESDTPTAEVVVRGLERAFAVLRELGAETGEVRLPPLQDFDACSRVVTAAEMYACYRNDLQSRGGEFSEITRRRLLLGAFVDAADYIQAQRLRRQLAEDTVSAMRGWDALVTVGINDVAGTFSKAALSLSYPPPSQRMPFNVTGHPALAVCCGFSPEELPLGFQIVGRHFEEATVLRIGDAYERATPWRHRRPALSSPS
jgi:aspartyl-tRNA(Asn)/glutamyl-tRNA(Gln) amidotransferase subunit A